MADPLDTPPAAAPDATADDSRDAERPTGPIVLRWIAGVAAVVVVGALGWSFWSAGQAAPAPRPTPGAIAPAPDFNQPATTVESKEDFRNLLAGAETGAIQLFNDKGVYAEIDYERLDPKPAGRFDLTAPSVWLYLDGGRAIRVEAEKGWLVQPAGSRQPESGAFEGDVRIRAHQLADGDPRDAVAAGRPLPEPFLTINTSSLRFDASIGEVTAPGEVQFAGPGFRATMRDLELFINEAERRLASLRSAGGGSFEWSFAESRRAQASRRPSDRRDSKRAASGDATSAREDLYAANFADSVRVHWGDRALEADALTVWARLVDGALPAGAILDLSATAATGASGRQSSRARAQPEGAGNDAEAFTPDIVATWAGPLRIAPLTETPPELENDHVALRFSAPTRGSVQIAAAESGLSASCVSLDAGLTTGRLAMIGAGDVGVSLRKAGAGVALAGRFELDVARGLGAFPGPGVIRAEPREVRRDLPPIRRDISWRGRADLVFATRDGALDFSAAAPLREAIFSQDVEARDGATSLSGQSLRALFAPTGSAGGALTRLIVEDQALLDAAERGRLAANRLDVHFRSATGAQSASAPAASDSQRDPLALSGAIAGDVEPDVATAEGAVRAQQGGASLRAELVEARFARDDAGELAVSNLTASMGVAVRTPTGDTASADSLRADLAAGSVDLLGAPAQIARGGASVEGKSLRLEREGQKLTVFSDGALRYEPESPIVRGYRHLVVAWSRSMQYDGRAGLAEFDGDVAATGEAALLRDIIRADHLVVEHAPRAESPRGSGDEADPLDNLGPIRRVVARESDEGDRASIESRRYALDESGRRTLAELVYLEGSTITADNEAGSLDVPGAGRLLIERRPALDEPAGVDPAAPAATLTSADGTTLFEWSGAFTAKRADASATMTRDVRLRQLPPGAEHAALIECERIEAWFSQAPALGQSATLTRAEATGAVYAALAEREMIADALVYDAAKAALAAQANPPNSIVLFDRSKPTPLTGAALVWDLARDRVEWTAAGVLTAPSAGFVSAPPADQPENND